MEKARIKFETDGGPWVNHNMPCPVNWDIKKAVFDMNNNIFQPSWDAQKEGWFMVNAKGWRGWLIRNISSTRRLRTPE